MTLLVLSFAFSCSDNHYGPISDGLFRVLFTVAALFDVAVLVLGAIYLVSLWL